MKVCHNVIFHHFPVTSPSSTIPHTYLLLWEDIHFENCIQLSDRDTLSCPSTCLSINQIHQNDHTNDPHLCPKNDPEHGNSNLDSFQTVIPIPNGMYVITSNLFCTTNKLNCSSPVPKTKVAFLIVRHIKSATLLLYVSYFIVYHLLTYVKKVPEHVSSRPAVPRPTRTAKLPSKYADYVNSQSLVIQLLQLDKEEACIPIPDNLSTLPHFISDAIHTDNVLDISLHQALADGDDPPSI